MLLQKLYVSNWEADLRRRKAVEEALEAERQEEQERIKAASRRFAEEQTAVQQRTNDERYIKWLRTELTNNPSAFYTNELKRLKAL